LWKETKIGDILPWDDVAHEAGRLLTISKANKDDTLAAAKLLISNCRGRYGLGGLVLLFILGSNVGGVGPDRVLWKGGSRGYEQLARGG